MQILFKEEAATTDNHRRKKWAIADGEGEGWAHLVAPGAAGCRKGQRLRYPGSEGAWQRRSPAWACGEGSADGASPQPSFVARSAIASLTKRVRMRGRWRITLPAFVCAASASASASASIWRRPRLAASILRIF